MAVNPLHLHLFATPQPRIATIEHRRWLFVQVLTVIGITRIIPPDFENGQKNGCPGFRVPGGHDQRILRALRPQHNG